MCPVNFLKFSCIFAVTFRSGTKLYTIRSAGPAWLQNADTFLEFKDIYLMLPFLSTLLALWWSTCRLLSPITRNIVLTSSCCLNWKVALSEAESHSCLPILNTYIWFLLENPQKVVGALYYWLCSQIVLCFLLKPCSRVQLICNRRPVSWVGRAPVCWAGGREFKPRPDHQPIQGLVRSC